MQNADDPQWITPTFAFPNEQLREEGVRLWVTQVCGEVRALRFELGVVILGMGGGGGGMVWNHQGPYPVQVEYLVVYIVSYIFNRVLEGQCRILLRALG
jgi:hypothetical protein